MQASPSEPLDPAVDKSRAACFSFCDTTRKSRSGPSFVIVPLDKAVGEFHCVEDVYSVEYEISVKITLNATLNTDTKRTMVVEIVYPGRPERHAET